MASTFARTTVWLALGTGTSRVLGLARTVMLGIAIGITGSAAADSFAVANKLPNVMFAVVAAGVLNAALIPQIVRSFHQNRERTVHRILTLGGFWILVATALLTVTAGLWVRVYSSGWGPEQTALATAFALWCIPQLFFYGMYTLLGQVLNAREQFGPFMWAPVVNNLIAIIGLAVYIALFGTFSSDNPLSQTIDWSGQRIALVAGVATLGIAAQAAVLIPPMLRGGYRWRWVWRGPKGELSIAAKVASWALAAVLVEQVAVWLTTRVASEAQVAAPGNESIAGVAAYDYALAIYLVPHSLVTVSIMTVLFTQMSRRASESDLAGVRTVLSKGVRSVGAFTMFAAAALVVLAPHVVRVIAPYSSPETVGAVIVVLQCLAIGLVPLGASVLIKQAYFALEDGKSVFLMHIPMAIAWVGVAWAGYEVLEVRWWVPAVAVGLTVSNTVAVALRAWGLRRRLGGLDGKRVALMHARALLAAVVSGAVGWLVVSVAPDSHAVRGWENVATSAVVVLVGGVLMLATYLAVARVAKLGEVNELMASLTARLRRRVR